MRDNYITAQQPSPLFADTAQPYAAQGNKEKKIVLSFLKQLIYSFLSKKTKNN